MTITTDSCFSTDDLMDRVSEDDLRWDLTADQFVQIQDRCSGNKIPPTWAGAQQWAAERSEFLVSEAEAHLKSECIDRLGEYASAVQYCDYQASDRVVAYRTTSGTIFWVFQEGGDDGEAFYVSLPVGRSSGNHHKSILLSIGGVSNADRDRWENTYKLPKGTPRETFEELWGEMKEVYDRILVPHGFPVMETYAESEARWAEMHQRDRKWSEGRQERLAEDYEDASEFEDYEA